MREGSDCRPRRNVRGLPAYRRGRASRRLRARRGKPHRRRQRPRGDHQPRAVCADARALQGLYHRRGSHALGGGVQRAAEDARGAAESCGVHPGDDRPAEGSRDHPFSLPAIRFPPHISRGHGRALGRGMRVRRGRVRGRGARFDRASRGRRPSQRAYLPRADHRVRRGQGNACRRRGDARVA